MAYLPPTKVVKGVDIKQVTVTRTITSYIIIIRNYQCRPHLRDKGTIYKEVGPYYIYFCFGINELKF